MGEFDPTGLLLATFSSLGKPVSAPAKELLVTAMPHTGYTCGSQVVVVNDNMVTKIYAPLYYNEFNECDGVENVVRNADSDYTREVAAYQEMQNSSIVRCTPMYHGSWTTQAETRGRMRSKTSTSVRSVRLILIEYIEGTLMSDIWPQ